MRLHLEFPLFIHVLALVVVCVRRCLHSSLTWNPISKIVNKVIIKKGLTWDSGRRPP